MELKIKLYCVHQVYMSFINAILKLNCIAKNSKLKYQLSVKDILPLMCTAVFENCVKLYAEFCYYWSHEICKTCMLNYEDLSLALINIIHNHHGK